MYGFHIQYFDQGIRSRYCCSNLITYRIICSFIGKDCWVYIVDQLVLFTYVHIKLSDSYFYPPTSNSHPSKILHLLPSFRVVSEHPKISPEVGGMQRLLYFKRLSTVSSQLSSRNYFCTLFDGVKISFRFSIRAVIYKVPPKTNTAWN